MGCVTLYGIKDYGSSIFELEYCSNYGSNAFGHTALEDGISTHAGQVQEGSSGITDINISAANISRPDSVCLVRP